MVNIISGMANMSDTSFKQFFNKKSNFSLSCVWLFHLDYSQEHKQ